MSKYTAICVTKPTNDLIGKLASFEQRLLDEIVALAIEARHKARVKCGLTDDQIEEFQS